MDLTRPARRSSRRGWSTFLLAVVANLALPTAQAGVLMILVEPTTAQGIAHFDAILERPDRIDRLKQIRLQAYSLPYTRVSSRVCKQPGWFAAAVGVSKVQHAARGYVCGAETKEEAQNLAITSCRKRAVDCRLEFLKFDDGTISFLDEYRHAGSGSFETSGGGTYAGGHGIAAGLDGPRPSMSRPALRDSPSAARQDMTQQCQLMQNRLSSCTTSCANGAGAQDQCLTSCDQFARYLDSNC